MSVIASAVSFFHFRERPAEPQRLEYAIPIPEKGVLRELALSPDGRYFALSMDVGNGTQLWMRALDSLLTQRLPGTEGAQYPFWSPDSRYIGFFTDRKLKKIAANGGPPQTLCEAPAGRGGTWNSEGVIVFAPAGDGVGLNRVAAAGGVPVPVTKPDGAPRYPVFLPDGRRFLYTKIAAKDSGIFLASLDSSETHRVMPDQSNAQYLPPGSDGIAHLLFVREQTLMAQPVNPRTLAPAGDLFPVAERVPNGPQRTEYLYTISENGMLLYGTGGTQGTRQLAWFDRAGKQLGTVGNSAPGVEITLSPDGKRVASARPSVSGRSVDLWISDLEHNTESELTLDSSFNGFPVWSPDGSKLAFASNRNGGVQNIYTRAANGTGQDELLFQSNDNKVPYSWSRDGRFILFEVSGGGVNRFALPVSGDHKPIALFQTANLGCCSQLSPDDRWLAYLSTESGLAQVYVQPFAPGATKPIIGKWQVSKGGSTLPRWRADGKELFFVGQDQKLMSVEVKATAETFNWGSPRPLFELKYRPNAGRPQYRYAPSPDGQRFLVSTDVDVPSGNQPLTMVVNWQAGLKK
jgi:Tol biopolymer transport system component